MAKLSNLIGTNQVADGAIGYAELSVALQGSIDQITTNKNNITSIINSKAAANGIATLDGAGKLLTSQLPALAIGDTVTVASEAAMFALTTASVQKGDVVVVATGNAATNKTYRVIDDAHLSTSVGYAELLFPEQGVAAILRGGVAQTGQVSLADVAFTGAANDVSFAAGSYTAVTVSGALVEVMGAVTTANSNITTLQGQMTTANGAITTLQSAVAGKLSLDDFSPYIKTTGVCNGTNKVYTSAVPLTGAKVVAMVAGVAVDPDDYDVVGDTVVFKTFTPDYDREKPVLSIWKAAA